MSQDTMDAEEDGRRQGRKEGADRERRRIRRAQMYAVFALRLWRQRNVPGDEELIELERAIDAATRANRSKRK